MKKIITIVLILALLSIGFQGVTSETIDYDVTIIPIMDFSIESVNSSFGTMQPHTTKIINPTFVVDNTKSACGLLMTARFTTENNEIYGLTNNNSVISADRFNLSGIHGTHGIVPTEVNGSEWWWGDYPNYGITNLDREGNFKNISIIPSQTTNPHHIWVNISADQEIGIYNGTIELIFEEHY